MNQSDETRWLLQEIEHFLVSTGMSPHTLGSYAVGNSYCIIRLRAGGDIMMSTAQKLRDFMRNWELKNGDLKG